MSNHKKGVLFKQSYLILVILLAFLFISTIFPLHAQPGSRSLGIDTSPQMDADGNKIFDDLDKQMKKKSEPNKFPTIVLFKHRLDDNNYGKLKRKIGYFTPKHKYSVIPGIAVTLTKGQILALSKQEEVLQIEYDKPMYTFLDTSTYWFGVQKARFDFSLTGDRTGAEKTYTKDDIVIAIVDTGIDTGHVDLDGGKVIGWIDITNTKNTVPYDKDGHGTHVASIVAGEGDGNPNYKGVAPGAALVGVNVFGAKGWASASDVDAGIQWVIDNKDTYGIEIMNLSLGSDVSSDGTDSTSLLCNAAVDAGIVTVAAAGNSGPSKYTIGSPAAAANVITIGGMADVGEGGFHLADFSGRGPTADERIKPDVSAPGWSIMAAKYKTTNEYVAETGTSMSAPFAAGVAALMMDANPSLTPAFVKSKMMDTAVDWGPTGADIDYGAGRLDAYEAIKSAGGLTGSGPTVPNHQFQADSLSPANSEDWWEINVTNTSYPVAATMIMPEWVSSSNPDFDMELYDPDNVKVASSITVTRQETISHLPSKIGTYKLKVYIYSGEGNYFFDLSTEGASTDTTPPAAVTDLATSSRTSSSITLSWTAPGDDGTSGTAAQYDIRYSTSPITDANWDTATQVTGEPTPQAAGSTESFEATGLDPGTTYYFALKTADEIPNWSGLSNILSRSTLLQGDLNKDGSVTLTDLAIMAAAYGSIPGDANWDPDADLNDDGQVGLTDLAILAADYGKSV